MSWTVTDSYSGSSVASSGSLSITFTNQYGGPSSGSYWGIVVVAADNAGTSGANSIGAVTDTAGNTYTQRQVALQDPGAASAGVSVAVYTSSFGGTNYTDDSISCAFSPATTSKAMWVYGLYSDNGAYTAYFDSGKNTGASTASPTVTTSSLPANAVLVCVGGAETNTSWTGDSDTTNGGWSSTNNKVASHGSGDLYSISLTTQYKMPNAGGTQTYNPTLGAAKDCILAWAALYENLPATSYDPMGMMGFYGI